MAINISDLKRQLADAHTDKEKIKRLLHALDGSVVEKNGNARINLQSFALGYLGRLLGMPNLNDFES